MGYLIAAYLVTAAGLLGDAAHLFRARRRLRRALNAPQNGARGAQTGAG